MTKVYTGKVMIPGDKIQEYFKIMAEAEKQRETFSAISFGAQSGILRISSVQVFNSHGTPTFICR
jgi:hypothetical protein